MKLFKYNNSNFIPAIAFHHFISVGLAFWNCEKQDYFILIVLLFKTFVHSFNFIKEFFLCCGFIERKKKHLNVFLWLSLYILLLLLGFCSKPHLFFFISKENLFFFPVLPKENIWITRGSFRAAHWLKIKDIFYSIRARKAGFFSLGKWVLLVWSNVQSWQLFYFSG